MYNLTAYDNLTSPLQVAAASNTASGGYLFLFAIVIFYIVMFIAFKGYDTKAVLVASSFICSLVGIFFWGADLITFKILIWPVLLLFGSVVALLFWPE